MARRTDAISSGASRKVLTTWFSDLLVRVEQLKTWSVSLERPLALWLPGLFNPMAYLTAIMQVTARVGNYPLDNMTTETHVTLMVSAQRPTHTT